MDIVPLIAFLLVLSPQILAQYCPKTPVYNATLAGVCALKNLNVLWPNYENVQQYYRCQGENNAVLVNCVPNTFFDFARQKCVHCDVYTPAQPCQSLPGQTCKSFTPIAPAKPAPTDAPYCSSPMTYTTTLVPACIKNDRYRLWPNYKNISEYYACQGEYNAVKRSCARATYFNYYTQSCTSCPLYEAAPPCNQLVLNASNKCEKL